MAKRRKRKEKALYWSSFNSYEKCGQQFLFRYGAPGIDVGGGPGKPKPVPQKRTEHHMILGNVVQHGVECLYNQKLYRLPPKQLGARLRDLTRKAFELGLEEGYVDWRRAPTHEEMLRSCVSGVLNYVKTMQANRFLGEYARAEKRLAARLSVSKSLSMPVAARVDMLIRRNPYPNRSLVGVTLLDGKNSEYKGKYVDPDQLRWYSLVYYLQYDSLPDRMGFVYYRFPYGTPLEPDEDGNISGVESGVEWIPMDSGDIRGIAQRGVRVRLGIQAGKFEADPQPPKCRFCDWEAVCEERQAQIEVNRRKRGGRKKATVPQGVLGADGFSEITFEDKDE